MEHLIKELSEIAWKDRHWRKEAEDILTCTPGLGASVHRFMAEWNFRERTSKTNGSHETSTHYKWLIHRDFSYGFTVWVHDYKPASLRRPGYAEVPHNHRYDFCSIILSGGYSSVLYDVRGGVVPLEGKAFTPGSILSLDCDQVHSLTDIVDETLTLLIEGPTLKDFSTAFPLDGPPMHFIDFNGRWDNVQTRLEASLR